MFLTMNANGRPAAAIAGFTWFMFQFCQSFSDLINAHFRNPPALSADGLLH